MSNIKFHTDSTTLSPDFENLNTAIDLPCFYYLGALSADASAVTQDDF